MRVASCRRRAPGLNRSCAMGCSSMPSDIRPFVDRLLVWFGENARDLPWRKTCDPYAIWISEVMLQQTQVKTVLTYWERWMEVLPDVKSLASASPEKVL